MCIAHHYVGGGKWRLRMIERSKKKKKKKDWGLGGERERKEGHVDAIGTTASGQGLGSDPNGALT